MAQVIPAMSKNSNPQVATKTNIQKEILKVQIVTPTKTPRGLGKSFECNVCIAIDLIEPMILHGVPMIF